MQKPPRRSDRTLIAILVVVAVLVIVAIVVVSTRGTPQPLDPGTPERAVQDYTTAVIDGDRAAAAGLLDTSWREDCEGMGYELMATDVRITLVDSRVHGGTATVTVSVQTGLNGGPFGGSGYEYEDVFQLNRVDGDWLIASAPWELAFCPGGSS